MAIIIIIIIYFNKLNYFHSMYRKKRIADRKNVKAFEDELKILIYIIKNYLQRIDR
mgnify:CR=1 FL=1